MASNYSRPANHQNPALQALAALADAPLDSCRGVVLIDGPSGAGKTTFAAHLAERTGWQLVHLDDFYPGWHGLARGAQMVAEDVLHPTWPGFRSWDWEANRAGEWVELDPARPVIVEGVGALSRASVAAAVARSTAGRQGVRTVMITGPREWRRRRALSRDPGYEPWFEVWERQEAMHFAHLPEPDVVLEKPQVR